MGRGKDNLFFLYNFSETIRGCGLIAAGRKMDEAIDSSRKEWAETGSPPLIHSREIEARVDLNPHSFCRLPAGMA